MPVLIFLYVCTERYVQRGVVGEEKWKGGGKGNNAEIPGESGTLEKRLRAGFLIRLLLLSTRLGYPTHTKTTDFGKGDS